ncbi:MAG TPA: twin-arginine translocase subunit TatB [Leucothrix mucor]|uniref:Sec-independent protein translocase protein TatB n=1 Tax=Leucothrix mucor TaxID=45248 RepID=A0A7V2T1H2_LEUMU|nr:twin-arginine translocase subunit TatB [Leucothrix mucor]
MFDAGFTEVMVIAVIALLVIGPERLPEVAAKVGGWIGKAKAFVSSTKADIEREFQASEMRDILSEQKKEIEELRQMVNETQDDFKSNVDDAKGLFEDNINSSIDDVKALDPNEKKKNNDSDKISETKKND